MRGEKEEKMQLDPLFPRIHINNTEQGGPRGAPRNKMTLSGQVNQTQRLPVPMSMPSLPSTNSTYLVPSASLRNGQCQKMNGFSLFCSSPEASYKADERLHSNYLGGMKPNTTKCHEYQILESGRRPLRMTSEFNLHHHHHHPLRFYHHSVNSSAELHWKEDDLRISCFGQREKVLNGGGIVAHKVEKELGNSEKHQTAFRKPEGLGTRTNIILREHSRNQAELTDEKAKVLHPLPSNDEKVLADASSLGLKAIYRTRPGGNREFVSLNHQRRSRFVDTYAQMHPECQSLQLETTCLEIVSGDPERLSSKKSSLVMEGSTCSSSSSQQAVKSVNGTTTPMADRPKSLLLKEVGSSSFISDTSPPVASTSHHLDITPDKVMRVIGPNFFWGVRRTIDHQQRIFAAQIFELHRLIEVQRLLAGSPNMLLESNVIFRKSSANISAENRKQQMKIFPEPKVDSQKLEPRPDYAAEDVQIKLPPEDDDSSLEPYSGQPTSTSFSAEDMKFGPCLFKPPSGYHQWLVPVKLPSEGLIYKPFTGPCPPNAVSIAPVYGSPGAVSLTRVVEASYVSTTCVFPASNQQHGFVIYTGTEPPDTLGHSGFQTYMHSPEMNTSSPDSGVMQLGMSHSSGQYILPYQSSCSLSKGSGMIADSGAVLPVLIGSDFQGSAGSSSPEERVQVDARSLFATTPADQDHSSQQKIQVIKVVPHNSKSASESAARIFQSIQEERKQHD